MRAQYRCPSPYSPALVALDGIVTRHRLGDCLGTCLGCRWEREDAGSTIRGKTERFERVAYRQRGEPDDDRTNARNEPTAEDFRPSHGAGPAASRYLPGSSGEGPQLCGVADPTLPGRSETRRRLVRGPSPRRG